jgi:ATP synthase subunit 6
MIATPLEQFAITPLVNFGSLFAFTNSSLFCLFAVGTMYGILYLSTTNGTLVPSRWQSLVEMAYEFVYNLLVVETAGPKAQKYFPLIFMTFLFIATCNLLGMTPYTFTVTSHIAVTLGIAMALFIGINIIGFSTHGIHFFSFFLPAGVPLGLAPGIVVIELVSYVFRVVSLSVRLFANMMAGHTLLKILANFAWTMMNAGGALAIASIGPLVVVWALTGLELAIAFLQAYVFTILTCIYLSDAIHLH